MGPIVSSIKDSSPSASTSSAVQVLADAGMPLRKYALMVAVSEIHADNATRAKHDVQNDRGGRNCSATPSVRLPRE